MPGSSLCRRCQAEEENLRIIGVWVVFGNMGEEKALKEMKQNDKMLKTGCWERQLWKKQRKSSG